MQKAFLFCDGIDPATKQCCDQQVEAGDVHCGVLPDGWWAAELPEIHGIKRGGIREVLGPIWQEMTALIKGQAQSREEAVALVDKMMAGIGHADAECDQLRADMMTVRDTLKKGNVEDVKLVEAIGTMLDRFESATPVAVTSFETYHFCPRHQPPVVAQVEDIPGTIAPPAAAHP